MKSIIFVVILALLLPLVVSVNNVYADTYSVSITQGAGASANANCIAQHSCFQPENLNIVQGSTVVWTNGDSVSHYISSGNPSDAQTGTLFDSGGLISPGATFSHTFNDVGTFNYFCTVHPWMTGAVTVQGGNNPQSVPNPVPVPIVQSVSVFTDKNSYNYGDTITISGSAYPVIPNQTVMLQIINPDGSVRGGSIQLYPSSDGSFSHSIPTSGSTAVAGTYIVSISYGNARNQVSFTYSGPPQQVVSTPKPIVQTDNGGLRYKMIFVYSLGQCTDFQRQAVNFYQTVTDQYLQKYGMTPSPETWCVSKNDVSTALAYGSGYAITIIIPDILTSIPYTVNSNFLGEYSYAGNSRAIVSTAYSITPESKFSAWTLSHELSHFILNIKGYPSSIFVDWVHKVQALKNTCESNDPTLVTCQYLWTTIQAPSGRAIPVMAIYQGPAPPADTNNTPTTPPPSSPTCRSGYYYHSSDNLCYRIVAPSLTLQSPSVNGLEATISGQSQAMTFGSSINRISWDWGDGYTVDGGFPQSHGYSQAGSYTVKVTTYDSLGSSRWSTEIVTVAQPQPTCPSGYYYQSSDNLCHALVPPSSNQPTSSVATDNNLFTSLTATVSTQSGILNIAGYISPPYYSRGNQIEIIITGPHGNQLVDQNFLTTQQVSQSMDISNWTDGTYDLKIKYGAYESPDVYFVKSKNVNQNNSAPDVVKPSGSSSEPMKVDGTDLSVQYGITNGKVLGIKADTQSKSLIVSIQTTGDGVLTVTLPRALINATLPTGQDNKYYVLVDGQESDFQETSTTITDRTLSIPFTDGTQEIGIIGTEIIGYMPWTHSSNQSIQSSPTTQEPSISGYIAKDSDQYTIPSIPGDTLSVKIHGHLDNISNGQVKIAWFGENKPESSTVADVSSNGDFTYTISFDSNTPPGKYQVTAYYGNGAETDTQNSIVDKTSFTLVSSNQQSLDNTQDKNKGKTCFLFWCW